MSRLDNISTESLKRWLANHRLAIELGMNVGQLDRDKAQRFTVEIHRREVAR